MAALVTASASRAETGESWRSDVHLSGEGEYGPSGEVSVHPRLAATWYFAPLLDDGRTPLALLDFHQHPGHVGLAVAGVQTLNATLSAEVYPWHETGLVASASGDITLGNAASSSTVVSLGVVRYFAPSFRLQLDYEGLRAQESQVFGTSTVTVLGNTTDRGVLSAQWILNDVFGVTVTGGVGTGRSASTTATVAANGGNVGTTEVTGLGWSGGLGLSGYFGRSFSATLQGEARGVTSSSTEGAATGSTFSLAITAGPTLQYFFTEGFYARLGYQAVLNFAFDGGGTPLATRLSHQGTVSLGGRF